VASIKVNPAVGAGFIATPVERTRSRWKRRFGVFHRSTPVRNNAKQRTMRNSIGTGVSEITPEKNRSEIVWIPSPLAVSCPMACFRGILSWCWRLHNANESHKSTPMLHKKDGNKLTKPFVY
jgi:hypothetical protein